MPELPEVETVRRGLEPVMMNGLIKSVKLNRQNLRYPFPDQFSKRLTNTNIQHVGRRGKYLMLETARNEALIMHLGMSGSFRIESEAGSGTIGAYYHLRSEARKHDHVVFEVENEQNTYWVIYNDPRRFGFMDLVPAENLGKCSHLKNMGIEPTGNVLNGAKISELFAGKNTPIKSALLDQRFIAGLGNIYVCEALWRSGISPKRKVRTICRVDGKPTNRSELLAHSIRDVLNEAIDAGGSSLKDHRQTDGQMGYFQHNFNVYDREGSSCPKQDCEGTIMRIVQSGRSTFYCPECQR